MEEGKKFPYKLEFGVWWNGKSHPIWVYDKVPEGMRPARSLRELWYGRPVLSVCMLGPDKGLYYTDYVRETTIEAYKCRLEMGIPVYVKDSK